MLPHSPSIPSCPGPCSGADTYILDPCTACKGLKSPNEESIQPSEPEQKWSPHSQAKNYFEASSTVLNNKYSSLISKVLPKLISKFLWRQVFWLSLTYPTWPNPTQIPLSFAKPLHASHLLLPFPLPTNCCRTSLSTACSPNAPGSKPDWAAPQKQEASRSTWLKGSFVCPQHLPIISMHCYWIQGNFNDVLHFVYKGPWCPLQR